MKNSTDVASGQMDRLSPREDRKLTAKIDLKLMPILGLLYLICFLDRTNIANARIAGMEKGLHMPKKGYNTALWIFYLPFVLAEVPLNMLMSQNWIKPNLFLGTQTFLLGMTLIFPFPPKSSDMLTWNPLGVFAMCQGLTQSYSGLLAIRFLMGIVETGLPAGAGLLIASYYRKKELSFRFALFFAFGQSGSCFSGVCYFPLDNTLDNANQYIAAGIRHNRYQRHWRVRRMEMDFHHRRAHHYLLQHICLHIHASFSHQGLMDQ